MQMLEITFLKLFSPMAKISGANMVMKTGWIAVLQVFHCDLPNRKSHAEERHNSISISIKLTLLKGSSRFPQPNALCLFRG